jgi:hypothetical protein
MDFRRRNQIYPRPLLDGWIIPSVRVQAVTRFHHQTTWLKRRCATVPSQQKLEEKPVAVEVSSQCFLTLRWEDSEQQPT